MKESKLFNPLEHPICLEFPTLLEETAWAEHIPFAMFLTGVLRPRVFVELGTFRGVSYCAFCQAVKSLQIDAKCYAIDTWQGDEHAGLLENGVLTKLKTHHDSLYAGFSNLVQSTFDEAALHFADDSVDLLHIDGLHTYEAVAHDFETWSPKMSERGVVLFHDTNVRERDFGVWKFWNEIKSNRQHFEFLHGHGLGVLGVGTKFPIELQQLFAANEVETNLLRRFFHQLGLQIETNRLNRFQQQTIEEQSKYIGVLQQYEKVVQKSRLMKFYRVVSEDGLAQALKKSVGKS
ncbi:MAG: class I SAM-dependent methyltransferase [Pyrinomonadaceae bacterium]|nr:class I SAM-dependent methyltransferase [Pyrinomonadaceae bacterium]